ncbi:hypothetical protein GQ54DRAFT_131376 [Martensiomyces pterosporus]|nr:hypothetical protein GQ54DRAFT_131376 [Martensiomyces pterosporus]
MRERVTICVYEHMAILLLLFLRRTSIYFLFLFFSAPAPLCSRSCFLFRFSTQPYPSHLIFLSCSHISFLHSLSCIAALSFVVFSVAPPRYAADLHTPSYPAAACIQLHISPLYILYVKVPFSMLSSFPFSLTYLFPRCFLVLCSSTPHPASPYPLKLTTALIANANANATGSFSTFLSYSCLHPNKHPKATPLVVLLRIYVNPLD